MSLIEYKKQNIEAQPPKKMDIDSLVQFAIIKYQHKQEYTFCPSEKILNLCTPKDNFLSNTKRQDRITIDLLKSPFFNINLKHSLKVKGHPRLSVVGRFTLNIHETSHNSSLSNKT